MNLKRREFINQVARLIFLSGIPFTKTIADSNEENPITRKIPNGNNSIPVVGIGTYRTFDKVPNLKNSRVLGELVNTFLTRGGQVVDTSPMYGFSEEMIGAIKDKITAKRSLFYATKVWTHGEEQGLTQISNSFKKMKVDTIDLLQIHNLVDWKVHSKTLSKLKETGRIKYTGITHYHEGAYKDLEKIMKLKMFDFVQFNFSLIEPEAEHRLLSIARDTNHAVIINRPFGGGQLFRKTKHLKIPPWSEEFDCNSWAQFFLKYILSYEPVTCAIPGTGNMIHLIDNLGASYGRLPDKKNQKRMKSLIRNI